MRIVARLLYLNYCCGLIKLRAFKVNDLPRQLAECFPSVLQDICQFHFEKLVRDLSERPSGAAFSHPLPRVFPLEMFQEKSVDSRIPHCFVATCERTSIRD